MGGGTYELKWCRWLRFIFPDIFIKCHGGNYHYIWHRRCYCRTGENGRKEPEDLWKK